MTNKERQLLLQDLCARLPYGVKYKDRIEGGAHILTLGTISHYERFIPYLRPMSSMTEDELNECVLQSGIRDVEYPDWYSLPKEKHSEARLKHSTNMFLVDSRTIDWLNKKMFDYRGLIPMGLALPAKEDMYNTKIK